MADTNDTSASERDSCIRGGLEELRCTLWRADGIIAMVRMVLESGVSDRDLNDNVLDEAARALMAASMQIMEATGKMEGEVFLRDVDKKSLKGDAAGVQP